MSSPSARCSRRSFVQLRQPSIACLRSWIQFGAFKPAALKLGGLALVIAASTPAVDARAQSEQNQSTQNQSAQNQSAQNQSAQNNASRPNHVQERVQALIEQLGSERFQDREAASAGLLAIGEASLLALAAAEHGADAEVRERARAIRDRIERDKFDVLTQSFMRDPDPTASYGLPGWKSFSRVAGSTRTAKRLFLDMIEQRRLVALSIEAVDGGSLPEGVFEGLPADPQQRLWTVIGLMCREVRESLYQKGERPVTGDVIALLTAVATLDNPPQDLHDTIKSEFQFGGLRNLLAQPGSRACTRKMLGKWFLKAPVTMAEDVISFAHQTQVPEGADMARRLLATPAEAPAKAQALICLAKFGIAADLDLIDKFVDDATVIENFEQDTRGDDIREERVAPPNRELDAPQEAIPGTRRKFQRTLGDVALAAGLKLSGFQLHEFFPIVLVDETMGVRETTIGFPVDKPEMRATALQAWRDFRAKKATPLAAPVQPES